MAGRPTPGADYYGLRAADQYPRVEELIPPTTELRVARSGRRLTAAEVTLWCGRGRSLDNPAVRLSLGRNPAAVVRRDGSFSFPAVGSSRTAGRVRLWLSGRFVSAQYARLFYRVRDFRRTRAQDCRTTHERYPDWSPAALYREGEPPFSGCRSQPAGTLLRTDTGRVFQQLTIDEFTSFVTHVYACLYALPHWRVDLGQNYDDGRVELPRLTGTLLAYAQAGCAVGGCQASIRVRDLAGGSVRSVSPVQQTNYYGPFRVGDLVLKQNGSLAWTVARGSWDSPTANFVAYDVWALDGQGARLLDSGRDIDLASLELNGSTLTWLNAGSAQSALLD